jgi:hypothetical protein
MGQCPVGQTAGDREVRPYARRTSVTGCPPPPLTPPGTAAPQLAGTAPRLRPRCHAGPQQPQMRPIVRVASDHRQRGYRGRRDSLLAAGRPKARPRRPQEPIPGQGVDHPEAMIHKRPLLGRHAPDGATCGLASRRGGMPSSSSSVVTLGTALLARRGRRAGAVQAGRQAHDARADRAVQTAQRK